MANKEDIAGLRETALEAVKHILLANGYDFSEEELPFSFLTAF